MTDQSLSLSSDDMIYEMTTAVVNDLYVTNKKKQLENVQTRDNKRKDGLQIERIKRMC